MRLVVLSVLTGQTGGSPLNRVKQSVPVKSEIGKILQKLNISPGSDGKTVILVGENDENNKIDLKNNENKMKI